MIVLPSPHSDPLVKVSAMRGWMPALVAIGAAVVIFLAGFYNDIANAVNLWIGSKTYNHCFVILPVVAYLLWQRRAIISTFHPQTALWPLLLLPPLSAVWLLAAALDINEGRQLLMIAMFEVVLLTAIGWRLYRLLLAPLLFLFFLVPSGAFLEPMLQRITADFAVAGLRLLNVPVFADGFLIDIPEGSFEIAEACAGLRFLIAESVFSCLFAVVMYRSWLRRGLYIALSIAAAIVANGIRAFGIIYLGHLSGSAAAVAADHIIYGWVFFSLVIVLLIGIGILMVERERPPPLMPSGSVATASSRWYALAVPLAALLALIGPSYAGWLDGRVPTLPFSQAGSPQVGQPWRALRDRATDWHPLVRGADREFLEDFAGPGSAVVSRYVALYRLHATGNQLTKTDNRVADDHQWRIARQGRSEINVNGQQIQVVDTDIISGSRRGRVWSFYVVDGRIVAGLLQAKLLQLIAVLHQQSPVAAFVTIAAITDEPATADRQLDSFLAASQSLPAYLDALAQ
jgi:exosortase A